MNHQKEIPAHVLKLLEHHKIDPRDVDYYAWPQTFGSTAGPHGGIGGQAMTTFTIEAYVFNGSGPTLYICDGCWKFEDERFEPFKYIDGWHK